MGRHRSYRGMTGLKRGVGPAKNWANSHAFICRDFLQYSESAFSSTFNQKIISIKNNCL